MDWPKTSVVNALPLAGGACFVVMTALAGNTMRSANRLEVAESRPEISRDSCAHMHHAALHLWKASWPYYIRESVTRLGWRLH
jgi:hypothetical protein